MTSGVTAADDCFKKFNALKLAREFKYIIYALTKDNKEIIVESAEPNDPTRSNESSYEEFLHKLPPDDCRYAVFDFEHEKEDGSGKRNRICFVAWSPDRARVKPKMVYSSSRDGLRKGLVGIHVDIQATDDSEISYETVLEKVNKLR